MSPALVLGIATPLLPVLGAGALLLGVLAFLLSQVVLGRRPSSRWAAPWLLLMGVWVCSEFGLSSDLDELRRSPNILTQGEAWPALLSFLRSCCLAALCFHFSRQRSDRGQFWLGAEIGLWISLLSFGLLSSFAPTLALPNQNEYFRALGRTAGTFSDPNALGIFLACAFPVLASKLGEGAFLRRFLVAALLIGLLLLGLYSGSRSFILGIGLAGVIWLWRFWPKLCSGTLIGLAALLVAVNVTAVLMPALVQLWAAQLPLGAQRVMSTLLLGQGEQAWFSRLAFWRIGTAVWLDHFFFGVGLQQFPGYVVQYAQQLGLPTAAWSDNANNFYLGVLAETGILGAATLVWSLSHLSRSGERNTSSEISLRVLAVLLFLGPHLDFDEVSVLAGVLLGTCYQVRSTLEWRGKLPGLVTSGVESKGFVSRAYLAGAIFVLLLLGVPIAMSLSQFGLYPWERDGESFFRWTRRTAQFTLRCPDSGTVPLVVRSLAPDAEIRPQTMTLQAWPGNFQRKLILNSSADVEVELPCAVLTSAPAAEQSLRVRALLDRAWTPAQYGPSSDHRRLGVQLRIEPGRFAR